MPDEQARSLGDSESKYRSLFALARDGIVLIDEHGCVADCNGAFEQQTGRDLATLRSLPVWDLRPPEDREQARLLFKAAHRLGGVGPVDQRFLRPDNTVVEVELSARPIDLGGHTYLHGITRDLRARREVENAIHERDERLRLVVEQLPAVIWTTNGDLIFTSSEGSALSALGVKPGEVVGKSLYEFFQTDDPEFLPISVHRHALHGVSASYETEWGGAVFESHTEPLRNENDEIIGVIGVAVDITKRKQDENRLKESEQQLRALASKMQDVREEESASIAREIHDHLGQSLTALKMDIAWTRRRIEEIKGGEPCGAIAERLATMSGDVDRTIKSVRELSTRLRPVILDDLGLVRALQWQAREFQRRTGIECRCRMFFKGNVLDDDRSTAVFRIFQEILTNVARHAQAKRVDVRLERSGGKLVLDVTDDGRGISESDVRSSCALGLLGMRERAAICGGELEVGRRNGSGTRVVVTIPCD